MHVAQELVAYLDKLSTLPTVYYKVREVLDDPDANIQILSDTIATDPALSSALLKLANSAFFGFPRKIDTLSRAVSLMGLEQVQDVVLATAVVNTFAGIRPHQMDMAHFWRNSVTRALLCKCIAVQRNDREPERLFVVGLLADTGHLVMYRAVPDLMGIVMDRCMQSGDPRDQVERTVVGCDYAEVGAALANSWKLPISFGVMIGAQLTPENAGQYVREAASLNLANMLTESFDPEQGTDLLIAGIDEKILALAEIRPEQIPRLIQMTQEQLAPVLEIFLPAAS